MCGFGPFGFILHTLQRVINGGELVVRFKRLSSTVAGHLFTILREGDGEEGGRR